MEYLKEEMFCPNVFDRELASQKQLANEKGELSPEYFSLSLFYRNFLEIYVGNLLGLQRFDDEITNSNLKFEKVAEEEKDVYQMFSIYNYFYLRNTIYIERLTIQDLNFLIRKLNKKDNNLDEETKEFLQRTYPLVVTSDIKNEETLTNYGPLSSSFFAPSNAIVFGIRCSDDFLATDDEWLEINFQQQNYLEQMRNKLNQEMKDKLKFPVSFLIYDDESVKKNEQVPNIG